MYQFARFLNMSPSMLFINCVIIVISCYIFLFGMAILGLISELLQCLDHLAFFLSQFMSAPNLEIHHLGLQSRILVRQSNSGSLFSLIARCLQGVAMRLWTVSLYALMQTWVFEVVQRSLCSIQSLLWTHLGQRRKQWSDRIRSNCLGNILLFCR